MANNLVTANFTHDSGLAEDVVVNAWSFNTAGTKIESEATAIVEALEDFYSAMVTYRSSLLNGFVTFKFYDRADAKPRVPWHQDVRNVGTSDSALPPEVALVTSFKAAPVSGQPPARRRGRLFIGPLSQGALSNTTGRPTAGVLSALGLASFNLLSASEAAGSWSWSIWSPTDNAAREVFEGWVDNEFDTQRRRGIRASERGAWGPTS
jgi:hypothetical protein